MKMRRYVNITVAAGWLVAVSGVGGSWFGVAGAQDVSPGAVREASPEEALAWNRVNNETDLIRKSEAAEQYLGAYPEGVFAAYAHEVVAVRALRNSDMDRFFRHGELAVAGIPGEVSLMSSLSVAYAEKQQPDPAIRHGEAALAILPTMERPVEYTVEGWPRRRDQFMADAHYGTGTAYLFKAFQAGSGSPLMATAMDHLVKATELLPRDERFRFRLGFAWQLNGEMEKAVLEYARAVALEGPNLALSRQYLDQAYEAVHGNRRNVDRLVAEQKGYLRELPAN